jgi:hypothetical protein
MYIYVHRFMSCWSSRYAFDTRKPLQVFKTHSSSILLGEKVILEEPYGGLLKVVQGGGVLKWHDGVFNCPEGNGPTPPQYPNTPPHPTPRRGGGQVGERAGGAVGVGGVGGLLGGWGYCHHGDLKHHQRSLKYHHSILKRHRLRRPQGDYHEGSQRTH